MSLQVYQLLTTDIQFVTCFLQVPLGRVQPQTPQQRTEIFGRHFPPPSLKHTESFFEFCKQIICHCVNASLHPWHFSSSLFDVTYSCTCNSNSTRSVKGGWHKVKSLPLFWSSGTAISFRLRDRCAYKRRNFCF